MLRQVLASLVLISLWALTPINGDDFPRKAVQIKEPADVWINTSGTIKPDTEIFVAEDKAFSHEAQITYGSDVGIGFVLKTKQKKGTCSFEVSGTAAHVYNPKESGGSFGWDSAAAEKRLTRYLGRKGNCIVEIRKNKKRLEFSTSNCAIENQCPTSSRKALVRKWNE